jgi:hypothetical protein
MIWPQNRGNPEESPWKPQFILLHSRPAGTRTVLNFGIAMILRFDLKIGKLEASSVIKPNFDVLLIDQNTYNLIFSVLNFLNFET